MHPFLASHKTYSARTLPDPAGLEAHSSPAFPSVRHNFNDDEGLVNTPVASVCFFSEVYVVS